MYASAWICSLPLIPARSRHRARHTLLHPNPFSLVLYLDIFHFLQLNVHVMLHTCRQVVTRLPLALVMLGDIFRFEFVRHRSSEDLRAHGILLDIYDGDRRKNRAKYEECTTKSNLADPCCHRDTLSNEIYDR